MTAALTQMLLRAVEGGAAPDFAVRWGIRRLCAAGIRARSAGGPDAESERFRTLLSSLVSGPIAVQTAAANEQHYELPPEFFGYCLGQRRKYSGCYWPAGVTTLDEAERASLEQTCARAELADGQRILELGCGWGSLTLWMAERYPHSTILAVSNARSQRAHIEQAARQRGLRNVEVQTADMNSFDAPQRYDRIVSVEMFEHMRNHAALMSNCARWLLPGGKLFVHVFVHRTQTYLFEARSPSDWITRYFFSGGIMPSDDYLLHHQRDVTLEDHWRLSGRHYERTANAWLDNLDRNRAAVRPIFARVYGADAARCWNQRWRVFFLACAELFGFAGGNAWGVSHYRFVRR